MGANFKRFTISEVASTLNNLEFKYEKATEQYNSPFFKEFSNLYNTDSILIRCSCKEPELFSEIIKSLHFFEQQRNDVPCLDNDIIKSLLTNLSLNPGPSPIAEFTDNCNWERFNFICFEKVVPEIFTSQLEELIEIGGLFFKTKLTLEQIRKLSNDFSDSIFQGRSQKVKIYRADEGWSFYFGKMGYDVTFFLFDEFSGEFWILAKTDYD